MDSMNRIATPSASEDRETVQSIQMSVVDIDKLLGKYTKVMEDGLRGIKEEMHDISVSLRKIDDRQGAAAAYATQPLPTVQATSSRAWTPLLNDYIETVQPIIDRWRGTLDTVLIFVALFSAIVATFFVQALTGLSEDPTMQTNRLIANLTEIYLLVHRTDVSSLNMTQRVPFQPEGSAVRVCFYWSLALISSVSIACLAVTMRGFVGKILRSRHKQAYQKLGDFQKSWTSAQRSLGPTVEMLPQLLAPPVLLFLVGFLDALISASLPLSSFSMPIFVAGLIACICFTAAGMYTAYMAVCDPLQDTNSILIELSNLTSKACSLLRFPVGHPTKDSDEPWTVIYSLNVPGPGPSSFGESMLPWDDTEPPLSSEIHTRFYTAICATHNDDTLDQAVTAIPSLIEARKLSVPQRLSHTFNWGVMNLIPATCEEVRAFLHLLSTDVSPRANLAMAASIATTLTKVFPFGLYTYKSQDTADFIQALIHAAKRYDISQPTIAAAIAKLLWYGDGKAHDAFYDVQFEDVCSKDSLLALLAAPFFEGESGLQCVKFVFQSLYTRVEEYWDSEKSGLSEAAELAFQMFMSPVGENFRIAFSHTLSRSRTCFAHLDRLESYRPEYTCSMGFVKWLFSHSSPDDLDLIINNYKQVVEHYRTITHIHRPVLMKLAGIYTENLAITTLGIRTDPEVGQRDCSNILETCAIFAQTLMCDMQKPSGVLDGHWDGRYTAKIVLLLKKLKNLDRSGLRLSDKNWHALYASASKYPPRVSEDLETHRAHIMRAFRHFVPDGSEYDLSPQNEARYA